MKRKILTLFLTLSLSVSAVLSTAVVSAALDEGDDGEFSGRDCTNNLTAASTIDYLMTKYPDWSLWKSSGECWGFAEKANSLLASQNSIKYYTGLKNTKSNFKKKCLGVMAGTHLRVSNQKSFNGAYGHSIVILKATNDEVYWADNNFFPANTVHYYSGTMDDLYSQYNTYKYINMVKQPTKYKTYTKPQIAADVDLEKGAIHLSWLRTTSTDKYQVYRSYSKNGTYKRIATTTSKSYVDQTAAIGKTAYYKVKAVKSKGSVYSAYTSGKIKLMAPDVNADKNENGDVVVSWEAIPNADRYKVYRSDDYGTGPRKLIKTTTELSYTDLIGKKTGDYCYQVKAVYDENSGGNSSYSTRVYAYINYFPVPTGLTGRVDGNNSAILSWNPVKGTDEYRIFCCDEPNGEYWEIGCTEGETTYTDKYRWDNEKYYYKVLAYDYDTGGMSVLSSWVWV